MISNLRFARPSALLAVLAGRGLLRGAGALAERPHHFPYLFGGGVSHAKILAFTVWFPA